MPSFIASAAATCLPPQDGGDPGAYAETAAIDTTGATLLAAFTTYFGSSPNVGDSKGNAWVNALSFINIHGVKIRMWLPVGTPVVGAGHTFRATAPGSTSFPAISVVAASGASTNFTWSQKGSAGATTSLTTPARVPPADNAFVIAAIGFLTAAATEPAGFTAASEVSGSAEGRGVATAYQIQTTATSVAPTWGLTPASSAAAITVIFAAVEEPDPDPPPPEEDPEIPAQFRLGHGRILAWLELFHKDTEGAQKVYLKGTYELWDNTDYYRGRKPALLLGIGYTDRGLTGPSGEFRAGTCTVRFSDADYTLRGWLDHAQQYGVINAEAKVWVISEEDWRARKDPVSYFHGRVGGYTMDTTLEGALELKDIFGIPFEQLLPLPMLDHDFPNIADEWRGKTVPLLMGVKNGEGSATAAPTYVADEAGRGGSAGSQPHSSYGDIGLAAATGLSAVEVNGAGNLDEGQVFDSRYAIMVVRIVGGVPSDPAPFLPGATTVQISGNGNAIDATCDNDGADAYRFYIGSQVAGGGEYLFKYYLETTDPVSGVRFTDFGNNSSSDITSGGVWAFNTYATGAVLAVMPDGRTAFALGGEHPHRVFIRQAGYRRPARMAWSPVPGALSYEFYVVEHPTNGFRRRWTVPTTQINGNGDVYWEETNFSTGGDEIEEVPVAKGLIPCIPLGKWTDDTGFEHWQAFLVSYGVIAEYTSFYQVPEDADEEQKPERVPDDRFGVTWAVPGKAGFSGFFANNYVTMNGRPYSVFFVRGPEGGDAADGTRPIFLNARGIKTENGDGGDCIVSGFDQLAWFLDNWWLPAIAQPDIGGDWNQTIPTFEDGVPKRLVASFLSAASESVEMMSGDIDRSLYLASTASPMLGSELLRLVLQGLDASFGQNLEGQAIVAMLPPHPASAVASSSISHINDILNEGFEVDDDEAIRATRVKFSYRYDDALDEYEVESTVEDLVAQALYRDTVVPEHVLELRTVTNAAQASQIGERALIRLRRPERHVRVPRPFFGIHEDLATRLLLTHPEGAALNGFTDRFLMINRVQPVHDLQKMLATCWDLDLMGPSPFTFSEPAPGSGPGAEAPDDLVEDAMSDRTLGGHRHISAMDGENDGENNFTGEIVPFDYRTVTVPWERLVGWTVTVRVWLATSAGTVTPRVRNLTDATNDATGTAHSATTFALQSLTLLPPSPRADKTYALFLDEAGGASAGTIRAHAAVRIEPA